jgi:anti-sigma B factor antagonist
MLKTTMKNENGDIFVTLEGRLDTLTSPGLEKELEPALADAKTLTLDVEKVEYISSAGLRTILEAQQFMEEKGLPNVKVINVNKAVAEVFTITGFFMMVDAEM